MKVYMGPYSHWWQPSKWTGKVVDLLEDKVHEDTLDKVEDFILGLPGIKQLQSLACGEQKVRVRIDPWDTFDMKTTLAPIIIPMLEQLLKNSHGYFIVDAEDRRHKNQPDLSAHKYVLEEMIWAFEQVLEDNFTKFRHGKLKTSMGKPDHRGSRRMYFDDSGYYVDRVGEKWYREKVQNGLRLFGKYYQNLWD